MHTRSTFKLILYYKASKVIRKNYNAYAHTGLKIEFIELADK